ncbi:MAG: nicotinate-nucleotide--dimethylbenzimidazole phosphoribosyltransferase [Chitinophagales bacterium]
MDKFGINRRSDWFLINDIHGSTGRLSVAQEFLKGFSICKDIDWVLAIFAGDNGVSIEKVSSYRPFSSNEIMAKHLNGTSITSLLMTRLGKLKLLIDVGLYYDIDNKELVSRKIAKGTRNIKIQAAMDQTQVSKALDAGRVVVNTLPSDISVLGIGEIGVANTISASVILAKIMGLPAFRAVGLGSDRTGELYYHRLQIVEGILRRLLSMPLDILRILEEAGSLEIAAMAGAIIQAGIEKKIVVLDGLVSAIAAMIAYRLDIRCKKYLFLPSTAGDPGLEFVANELDIKPFLDLAIDHGEGLAAIIGMFFLEIASVLKNNNKNNNN